MSRYENSRRKILRHGKKRVDRPPRRCYIARLNTAQAPGRVRIFLHTEPVVRCGSDPEEVVVSLAVESVRLVDEAIPDLRLLLPAGPYLGEELSG